MDDLFGTPKKKSFKEDNKALSYSISGYSPSAYQLINYESKLPSLDIRPSASSLSFQLEMASIDLSLAKGHARSEGHESFYYKEKKDLVDSLKRQVRLREEK